MKQKSDKIIRVLLVDDHPVLRRGVSQLISGEPDMTVCGEAGDTAGALKCLQGSKPGVVVTDISMKGRNGIELIKDIVAGYPGLPILVLSIHTDAIYAERALRAGAMGYITKQDAPDLIISAIRKIAAGQVYVCEDMASKLLSRMWSPGGGPAAGDKSPVSALSDREMEILEMIGRGLGTSRIAALLSISVNTIETHRARIKEKLGLATAAELSSFSVRWLAERV